MKIQRELYLKLPQDLKEIITSQELAFLVEQITKENSLNEDQHQALYQGVVDLLIGSQKKEDLESTLLKTINANATTKILNDLEVKILNNKDEIYRQVAKDLEIEGDEENMEATEPLIKKNKEQQNEKQNNVGQSFEQIILNQARAMRPAVGEESAEEPEISDDEMIIEEAKAMQSARPTDESDRIMNHESRIMDKKDQIPETQEKPVDVPNYGGNDPYREPLN